MNYTMGTGLSNGWEKRISKGISANTAFRPLGSGCTISAMLTGAEPLGSTTPLTPLMAFWWGAGGSLAIEILSLYNEIRAANASGLPAYYKNPLFWFVRLLVTAIAGGLAIAEEAAKPLLAINIGASAPAILQLLTKPAASAAPGVGVGVAEAKGAGGGE